MQPTNFIPLNSDHKVLRVSEYLRNADKFNPFVRNFLIAYALLLSAIPMVACPTSHISFSTQAEIDNFPINYPNCSTISGDVYISGPDIIDLTPLAGITTITGSLIITENDILSSLAGLSGLTSILWDLNIGLNNYLLTDIGLQNLQSVAGAFNVLGNPVLTTLTGLGQLVSVQHIGIYNNPQLLDVGNLPALTTVQGDIDIIDNSVLKTIDGLETVTSSLGDIVNIWNNPALLSLQGLHNIIAFNGDVKILSNSSLTTCAITSICTHLSNGGIISFTDNGPSGCNSQIEVENICNNIACTGFNIAAITATAETAVGANDGTATVVGGGASGAYNYQWTLGNLIVGNTATIVGLTPGTYSITVTDQTNANCTMTQTVIVLAATPPVQFILCDVSGAPGSTVQVPVKVVGFNNVTSFAMSYNIAGTGNAQFVTPNPIGSPAFSSISSGPNTSSQVNVNWVSPTGQSLVDSSVVFTISMVLGANNATVPITIGGNGNATALEVTGIVNGQSVFLTGTGVNNNVTIIGVVNPPNNLFIGGQITVENQRAIQAANVNITGGTTTSTLTNTTGDYSVAVAANTTYTIAPFEDDNHGNGVDLVDMIRIARHIANIEYLASPLQLIAADVNRDGRVNSRDRSEIFQIVLGRESRFDNNTSWRFIPKTHVFPASTLPPTGQPGLSYPENITVNSGTTDMNDLDFWGVKIGDINFEVNVPFTAPFLELSMRTIEFPEEEAPTSVSMPIIVDHFDAINGVRFAASWDKSILKYAGHTMNNSGNLIGDVHVNNGRLNAVILDDKGENQSLPSNSTLMVLKFDIIKVGDINTEIKMPDNEDDQPLGSSRQEVVSTIASTSNTNGISTSRSSQNNTTLAISAPILHSGRIIIRGTTIPTISQWGLLIFGLLLLNIGVIGILKKEQDGLLVD